MLQSLKHPRGLLTLTLVLFALWLRFRLLGYSEMWIDQSATLSMALKWIHGGPFPLTADSSSAGTHNPPLVEYLYAIPLAIRADILDVQWFLAFVNLLGLLAAGWAVARVFGWRAAWWATLLFVVNPWGVLHGRLLWMPSFTPAFAALLFACTLLYFAEVGHTRYLILGALCLSATLQSHLTAFPLIGVLGLLLLVFFRRVKLRDLVASVAIFILSFAPYIIFQIQTRFTDFAGAQAQLSDFSATNLAPVLLMFDLVHSVGVYTTLWSHLSPLIRFADDMASALLVGALLGAVGLAFGLRRGPTPRATGALILLGWALIPLPFYIRHAHYLYTYYFLYLLPALCTLLAVFSDTLSGWLADGLRPRLGPAAPFLALIAFAPLTFVAAQQGGLAVVQQNYLASGAEGHRRILDVRQAIANARALLTARPACQLVLLEADPFYDFRALLSEFTDPARARFAEVGQSYLYPDPCAVYLSTTQRPAVETWLNAVAQPLPASAIHTPQETWTFYDLPPAARAAAVADLQTDAPLGVWANGAQLNHFQFAPALDGQSLTLTYTWEINATFNPAETRARLLTVGNYLLDSHGGLVSQLDGPGRDSTDWRVGDIFQVTWQLPLPPDLPPGEYALATAFYLYPELQRVPLVNEAGDLLVVDQVTLPTH